MTVGIYSITHRASGKRYIGKSINIESRLWSHKYALTRPERDKKHTNRHLYNAVQKHGWEAFATEILETFVEIDEALIAARELHWMDHYRTCDRTYGYNLRRDSSTKMIVHEETRAMQAISMRGAGNPNFGNNWSDEQKLHMGIDAHVRHLMGNYGQEWRDKLSIASSETWKDEGKKRRMAEKVSRAREQYDYLQLNRDGTFVRRWTSVKEIVAANPEYKWQNIYNVCHGYKPTYRGFIWRQVRREDDFSDILGQAA